MPITVLLLLIFNINNVYAQFKPNGTNLYHNTGNVGIGTNAPSKLFEISSAMTSPSLRLTDICAKCAYSYEYWDIENNVGQLNFIYGKDNSPAETLFIFNKTGQFGIGTTNLSNSAIMEMNSTAQGLLIPRMTTTEKTAINSPANSLMVFDTDLQKFSYYDNTDANWYSHAKTSELSDYLLAADFDTYAAADIATADIENWNTAYNFSQNFTETDPDYNSWDKNYDDLTNKPELFDRQWNSLEGTAPGLSTFPNDAGYITELSGAFLWERKGNTIKLINNNDYVGIGLPDDYAAQAPFHVFRDFTGGIPESSAKIRLENSYLHPIVGNEYFVWDIESQKDKFNVKFASSESNQNINTQTIFTITNDGFVGIGTDNPQNPLQIKYNNTELLRVRNDGYVGIGWGQPDQGIRFQVDDNFTVDENGTVEAGRVKAGNFDSDNYQQGVWNSNDNGIYFSDDDKNVGIGTTTPTEKLHIKGDLYLEHQTTESDEWIETNFFYSGHHLIFGSKPGLNKHNSIQIKPGGSSEGSLFSTLTLFEATAVGQQTEKVQIHSNGDSYFNGGNVGIGTDSPAEKLEIKDGAINLTGTMDAWTTQGWRARIQTTLGTAWACTTPNNDDNYLGFGMASTGWYFMSRNESGEVDYPVHISETGDIVCSEVVIRLDEWKDNVFEKNYKLRTIEETEQYISQHGHLPEIPSEKEMTETGLETSEMVKLQSQPGLHRA